MQVYGDRVRIEDPRAKLEAVEAAWRAAAALPADLRRHSALVGAFVEASELAQGLADLEFERAGEDDGGPLQEAAMALLLALGGEIEGSWTGELRASTTAQAALELKRRLPAARISARQAEGHAFYALYPEAYWEAARALPKPARCLGLRSIGTGLAAMAAVAVGDKAPLTVRPVGPPFRRRVKASQRLRALLRAAPDTTWAVADEGPGLSGSSFAAAADLLEGAGVARGRLVFLPSHRGAPGPHADPAVARRWAESRRAVVEFDAFAHRAHGAVPPLERWFVDLTGEPQAPLEDLSAGGWRARLDRPPPANAALERRKFLLRAGRGEFLLKFAGLGREGSAKLERARVLHRAGFTPEPLDLRHGFLCERWRGDARPLADDEPAPVERLAAYLRFRAEVFPADRPGAGLSDLAAMARVNAEEALGSPRAARLAWTEAELKDLQKAARPVVVDGRLHRWEWLRPPAGALLKTDALDHACAHDLIGPQDLAWDLAGAAVEFDLSPAQEARLLGLCGYGTPAGRALVGFMRLAYLAFQLGLWSLAGEDDGRPAALVRRYVEALDRRLP